MTLVQLRHFIALAELGSFARASKALFLTQPALSRSIQALEAELAQALFDRVGRRIELTAMGLELLPRAKILTQEAEALKTLGKRMQAGVTGHMNLMWKTPHQQPRLILTSGWPGPRDQRVGQPQAAAAAGLVMKPCLSSIFIQRGALRSTLSAS
ncbi:transcriptional regulator [Serpentinimonas raichei]|uniref:Transcriptional regulator n=1 Tax=Serpentinimonas raichei TaxID=1458425 RepID=A0A060NHS1_9BURK|nr:LysR family transcriptional regulator [Serpentinimonas raichei]BAO80727.1 transcriptional regulator [Serpentinimonas raichei]